jgi:hypothetical protein
MTDNPEEADHPVRPFLASFVAAWNADDLDSVRALLHPDLYAESHRTFTALGTVRGDDAHEAVLSFHLAAPHCHFDVVETRPDGHAAGRFLLDDGGVAELEIPVVLYLADGRLVQCATFDAGDLDDALALLDEWAAG